MKAVVGVRRWRLRVCIRKHAWTTIGNATSRVFVARQPLLRRSRVRGAGAFVGAWEAVLILHDGFLVKEGIGFVGISELPCFFVRLVVVVCGFAEAASRQRGGRDGVSLRVPSGCVHFWELSRVGRCFFACMRMRRS